MPPRFWWLKRGAVGFGLLLVMLCILRFWWGHEAERRIEAVARKAHARGEPFYPQDFAEPSVPDAENAAVPILMAIKQLRIDLTNGLPNLENGETGTPLPGELPQLMTMIRHFRSEMSLVRQAHGRASVFFIEPPEQPPYGLNDYRAMSEILVMAANYEHAIGHDGEAVDYLNDAITLTDTFDRGGKLVIDHLVTEAMSQLWTDFIQNFAMGASVSDGPGASATSAQVRTLIAELVNDDAPRAAPVVAARAAGIEAIDYLPQTDLTVDLFANKVLAPMYKLDGLRVQRFQSANAQAYLQPTYAAARLKLSYSPGGDSSALERLAHSVAGYRVYPPLEQVRFHFQMLTERRVCAVMLAIRLYQFDHRNKLPATLSELVPAYLPAVPRDPFDPADGPIRYLPMHDPPVLYSLGLNLTDDGGSSTFNVGNVDPPWSNKDAVFPLEVHPRVSPAQDYQSDK